VLVTSLVHVVVSLECAMLVASVVGTGISFELNIIIGIWN
jgi:hypothetical protein